MKLALSFLLVLSITFALSAEEKHNTLSDVEKKDGWKLLFDGKTTAGWNSWKTKKELVADKWVVEDGALMLKSKGAGDIYTAAPYENYELVLEWKATGNSGILLRVNPSMAGPIYKVAPEMQILNKAGKKSTDVAGFYALIPVEGELVFHKDSWNKVRIRMENGKGTHWFNGKKIYEYEIGSADWKARVAKSKFKNWKGFGETAKGHIGFQDHGAEVAFRNVKIKVLK
jgi:hypothetical protein